MKDLKHLAEQHHIERKLYYSDEMEKICRLIDDNRITRWLSSICDKDLDEEKKWEELVLFLEKEIKMKQQR